MKISAITAFCFAACTTQPTAPPPEPTSSASAPPVASSAEPLAPAPVASASASAEPPSSPDFVALNVDEWNRVLPGRWIGAASGDSIPSGPAGSARAVFVHKRPGSKTPWNVTLWRGATPPPLIVIGCGFYPSGTAYCKVQGSKKAVVTEIKFLISAAGRLRMQAAVGDDVADAELVRAK